MDEHRGLTVFLMIGGVLFIAGLGYFLFKAVRNAPVTIDSFDDCMKAGYEILETNPAQCRTSEGKSFDQGN